jgi:hypothetical protein
MEKGIAAIIIADLIAPEPPEIDPPLLLLRTPYPLKNNNVCFAFIKL